MLAIETIACDNFSFNNKNNFSFGKSNNYNNNLNKNDNKMLKGNENINNMHQLNDKERYSVREKNSNFIYKLLNKRKESNKDKYFPAFSNINNINQANNSTKPKIDIINNNYKSPEKSYQKFHYSNSKNKDNSSGVKANKFDPLFNFNRDNSIKKEIKKEMLKVFGIKNEDKFPYEIKYFLDNPEFYYDFHHQNDINYNYQYINENFIDILINSYKEQIILNFNIKPMKEIQTEITFSKRNILISWLTEINLKYIKDQNVFFTAVKFLDKILYRKNIDINDFQLIGILCFNLSLKMENHYKVLVIEEIISLIGGSSDKNGTNKYELRKKIIKMENKICDWLGFDLATSTSALILQRLIQLLNISNKKTEEIFLAISYFFLELSLYEEHFYKLDEFSKALSSLLIAKGILKKMFYKIGFHSYLLECSKLKKKEINYYYSLCIKSIQNLKSYKYGSTIFIKYQHKDFYDVINNYLNPFIIECIRNKDITI